MIWCSFVCFVLTFVGAVGPWAGVAGNCALRPQVPMRKLCATGSLAPISFSPSAQHLLPVLSPSHMSSDRSLHQFLLLCLLSSFLSYPERSVTRLRHTSASRYQTAPCVGNQSNQLYTFTASDCRARKRAASDCPARKRPTRLPRIIISWITNHCHESSSQVRTPPLIDGVQVTPWTP